MAKYRVRERQVLVYTWDVDSDDLPPGVSLEDALGAVTGVPDDADCHMLSSETTAWECVA